MKDDTNKPILKVGDKVRIKSKEWFDSQYKSNREDIEPPEECNRPFFDFMQQYCGNICTIKYIYTNNVIKFNENDEDWESWMFDPVKKSTEEKSKKRRPFFIREPQTGDTIKSPYFNGIIIGENDDKGAFLILTTPYFDKQWLDKDFITEIDGYGRYLYHIDTNECDLDIRADKLRKYFMSSDYYTEKVTTSEEQLSNNKDNDSQSNSSKFDLSRVIYRSRRTK